MSDTPKSIRQVNRADLANLCNVSPPTVDKWVAQGAPFISRGNKGTAWVFDIGDVIAWRIEFAVKAAVAPYQITDVGVSREEADRRRAVALAIVAEIEAAVAQQSVVYVEQVGRLVEQEYGLVRSAVLSLPGKLADRCVGKDRAAIRLILDHGADEVLSHLSNPDEIAGKAA